METLLFVCAGPCTNSCRLVLKIISVNYFKADKNRTAAGCRSFRTAAMSDCYHWVVTSCVSRRDNLDTEAAAVVIRRSRCQCRAGQSRSWEQGKRWGWNAAAGRLESLLFQNYWKLILSILTSDLMKEKLDSNFSKINFSVFSSQYFNMPT